MVSPCKKKRFDKKGKTPVSHNVTNQCKKKKPLLDKKFYLDIRNNVMLKKIEEKLIALGGVIEVFLVRDVDYVVTDRKSTGSSPGLASTPSPVNSPSDVANQARTRSRGEAMLEKVKQQTLKTTCDIFNKASSWNIPIYPLQRFLLWLEKASKKAVSSSSGAGRLGLRELRGNYLKVEPGAGTRPDLRVLPSWPRLDLTARPPFPPPNGHDHANGGGGRMTRKQSGKGGSGGGGGGKDGSSSGGGGSGYCEVCRVNYAWLDEHIASDGHSRAVSAEGKYRDLDTLIGAAALTGLRSGLRSARSPPPVNGHSQRLRSRVSRKRLSAEEKLIEDNKAYYKVEVLNSKLRSTGVLQRSARDDDDMGASVGLPNGSPPAPSSPPSQPVVVRFKKVRKSILSVLSDEAESFMFGPGERKEEEEEERLGGRGRLRRPSHPSEDSPSAPHPASSPINTTTPATPPVIKQEIKEEEESDEDDVKPQEVSFSFEMDPAPIEGIWYETKLRQDTYKEYWLPMYYKYPKVLLPSELPYQERLTLLQQAKRTRMRKYRLDDRPRKSPRCHASTLAMLSSGRKPDVCVEDETTASSLATQESSSSDEPPPPPTTLSRIQGTLVDMYDPTIDRYGMELLKAVNSGRAPTKIDVDLRPAPCLPIDPAEARPDGVTLPTTDQPPDVLNIIRTFESCTSIESVAIEAASSLRPFDAGLFDSCASSDCSDMFGMSDDTQHYRPRRKKKRNLTGWPHEKPKKKGKKPPTYLGMQSPSNFCNFLLSPPNAMTPKRSPGRPRIYPPGMSPSMKKKLAALNKMNKMNNSSSPIKVEPKSPRSLRY